MQPLRSVPGVPMPGRVFCTRCGGVIRSPNHVCQPASVKHFARLKRTMEAQTAKPGGKG